MRNNLLHTPCWFKFVRVIKKLFLLWDLALASVQIMFPSELIVCNYTSWSHTHHVQGMAERKKYFSCLIIIMENYLLLIMLIVSRGTSLLFRMYSVLCTNVHNRRCNRNLAINCDTVPFLRKYLISDHDNYVDGASAAHCARVTCRLAMPLFNNPMWILITKLG